MAGGRGFDSRFEDSRCADREAPRIVRMERNESCVVLDVALPAGVYYAGDMLYVETTDDLVCGTWSRVIAFRAQGDVLVESILVPYAYFHEGIPSSVAFFRIAGAEEVRDYTIDSDGDGLSDGLELELGLDPVQSDTDGDGVSDALERQLGMDPCDSDTDHDGLADGAEIGVSDPLLADTDADGIDDGMEMAIGTNPACADTDGDGLPDRWEVDHGLDPCEATGDSGASGDFDGDGLSNLDEYQHGTNPADQDTDADGVIDGQEVLRGMDPFHLDSDRDGVPDFVELVHRWNPVVPDTDGDGLPDGWEYRYSLNPASADGIHGGDGDWDSDGLSNMQEYGLGTLPYLPDTGGDGLADGIEVALGTDPLSDDTDGDGLSDQKEAETLHTDPLKVDTDSDGLSDWQEMTLGTSPLVADTDEDGLPDGWEVFHGFNPLSPPDGGESGSDDDEDGLTNGEELAIGSDPHLPDTDSDGLADAVEAVLGTDPACADSDGDGVGDEVEVSCGTDPTDADEDRNGILDGFESEEEPEESDPDDNLYREIAFDIGGDYAAWTMIVVGEGPHDATVRRLQMGGAGLGQRRILRLRKGNRYRLTMVWLNSDEYDDETHGHWYCWKARIDGLPHEKTYDDYSTVRRERLAQRIVGPGWIADNADGLLTEHVHECDAAGGNVARHLEARLYVLDDPRLVPDYNRDGVIDSSDVAICDAGDTVFRFWMNDDEDADSVDGKWSDKPRTNVPGAKSGWFKCDGRDPDFENDRVDGECDLLDFTPIWVDFSRMTPGVC